MVFGYAVTRASGNAEIRAMSGGRRKGSWGHGESALSDIQSLVVRAEEKGGLMK